MKTLILLTIFFVLAGCGGVKNIKKSAPSTIKYKDEAKIIKWLEKHTYCDDFLNKNKKPKSKKKIFKCFEEAVYKSTLTENQYNPPKNLLSFMLQKITDFNLPQSTLTEMLKYSVGGHGKNSNIIKVVHSLINAGASTRNIGLQYILDGQGAVCEVSMILLNKNKDIYKTSLVINKGGYKSDLHYLTDAGSGRFVCPKVIKRLVYLNKRTLNITDNAGDTPLHRLFLGFSNANNKDIELAKALMTRKNVNMQSSLGDTPLHHLLFYSQSSKSTFKGKDILAIRAIIKMGGKLTIKNKDGITAQSLILKRPDLAGILRY